MSITLSKRLEKINKLVPNGARVGDIGSDHGYLIASLALGGKINKGYACDNKKGPFLKLKDTILSLDLHNKIDVDLSDGIRNLPSYINCLVIAGMGGDLILNILNENKEKLSNIEHIILDPHTKPKEVRQGLINLGYFIEDEDDIIEDHIYYQIIKFKKGNSPVLNDNELEFGPILLRKKSSFFKELINKTLQKNNELLKLNLSNNRRREIEAQIERIKDI